VFEFIPPLTSLAADRMRVRSDALISSFVINGGDFTNYSATVQKMLFKLV